MSPLQNYLVEAKARLLAGPAAPSAAAYEAPHARPTLVVGNMAGDLDTIVSSIVVAFCRHAAAQAASSGSLVVPVIPFPRAEFRLRQDAAALFKHCAFELDGEGAPPELLFWDELSDAVIGQWRDADGGSSGRAVGAAAQEAFELVLTDHNQLDSSMAKRLGARVVCIVDHHADSGAHSDTVPQYMRTVDSAAGSASSLVSELLELLPESENSGAQPAALLLGAIVADTRGFAPDAKKFSPRDVKAGHRLLATLGAGDAISRPPLANDSASASAIYSTVDSHADWLRNDLALPPAASVGGASSIKMLAKVLTEARFDVSHLSVVDLLALDFKATSATQPQEAVSEPLRIGVAAVFVPMADLLLRAGGGDLLAKEMGDFADKRGVDVLLVLSAADDRKAVRKGRGEGEGEGALTGLKGAALIPAPSGGTRAAKAAQRLALALERAPVALPPGLLAEPLFKRQAIDSEGFGLEFSSAEGGSGLLRVSMLRRAATRKTVLPAVAHYAGAL